MGTGIAVCAARADCASRALAECIEVVCASARACASWSAGAGACAPSGATACACACDAELVSLCELDCELVSAGVLLLEGFGERLARNDTLYSSAAVKLIMLI